MHTKKQSSLAFLICAAFIIVTLFSTFFIVKEANHNCSGEDCPICACVHQTEQTLKQLGTGTIETAALIPGILSFIPVLFCMFLFIPCTSLVSQKVRLDD
ncbi:hypothetical protein [Konateibacter massiliensis]|uniref:hypothetical protein n=1 Tax=Konateibacter massiliensis TaxID=2002841 RepID=UPI000C15C5FE|nr:hypothetical protein [Konateibacter massiliensis]